MADDIELLRLKAKAKLKFRKSQQSAVSPVSQPEKPIGVLGTAFPGVMEAKGFRKIPAAIGDIAGAGGQLISAAPFVAKAAFTQDPQKKRELALKGQSALRGESPGFFRKMLESKELGGAALAAPFTGGASLLKAGAIESGAGVLAEQAARVGREEKIQPIRAAGETAAGALVPAGLARGMPAAATAVNKVFGRTTAGLSGVSEKALRKFGFGVGKGAKELKKASQTQNKIAKELLEAIDNAHNYLPEEQIIRPALDQIQDVPLEGVYKTLMESVMSKRVTPKAREQMVGLIDGLKKDFGDIASGSEIRDLRIRLDKEIGDKFGEATGDFISGIKNGRAFAQNLLIENSTEPGIKQAFASESRKFAAIDDIKLLLGKKGKTRELRTEAILDNLFGKNKTKRREMLKNFQDVFGGDFLERSELARLASTLGPEGVPGFIPEATTGRSLLGIGGFNVLGDIFTDPIVAPIKTLPLLLASPRIGAGALSLTSGLQKAGKFAGKVASEKHIQFPFQRGTTASFKEMTDRDRKNAIERQLNGGR